MKIESQDIENIVIAIKAEYKRLSLSGAVGEKTPIGAVIRVALENVAARYSESADVKNLRKI